MIRINPAGTSDLEPLAELFDAYRQFYKQASDLLGARAFLAERLDRQESVAFLAMEEDEAVGFTQLYPSFTSAGMARIFVLNDLYVRPEFRGRGVATALLQHASAYAREAGAVRLTLSTERANAAAQALYERLGWGRDERFFVYNLPIS